ncbi:hypothetical protein KP509_34G072500 [Ceratopteris richardii]|uniref:STI1/HOP DP domain-containing protein n=1 Tax=Ceratopteris richardii TaxID=49495 RepID=A0A8T2QLZ2_CERRI|nr:hypothetical protein KP509_34G072500 [Ceratopteris richardii]
MSSDEDATKTQANVYKAADGPSTEREQGERVAVLNNAGNPFDFSEISGLLNDPKIQELAQQIARDPSFRNMAGELQHAIRPGLQNLPQGDSAEYFKTMQQVMNDPQFLNMAEKLSSTLMQDPASASILQTLRDSEQNLKDVEQSSEKEKGRGQARNHVNLMPIVEEIERDGPSALMKYIDDPQVLNELENILGFSITEDLAFSNELDSVSPSGTLLAENAREINKESLVVHIAASAGDAEELKTLLKNGADKNEKDAEGRVALHLACGYGAIDCSEVLLEAGVPVDSQDTNNNTALHYASGYGKRDCVELLLNYGASVCIISKIFRWLTGSAPLQNKEQIARKYGAVLMQFIQPNLTT